jgi:hemerythrin
MSRDFPMEIITGIQEIDIQHMELVARIKKLHESFVNGMDKQKLLETFEYVKCYINEHFATEESYMLKLEYPYFERHLKAHDNFTAEYLKLRNLLKEDGTSTNFNLDFNVTLINWMKNHVLEEDKILAEFIRKKEGGSAPEQEMNAKK